MNLSVQLPKTVTFVDGGGAPQTLTTTASSLQQFLAQRGVPMGPADTISPLGPNGLTNGATIAITRNAVTQVTETSADRAADADHQRPDDERGHRRRSTSPARPASRSRTSR